jgi:SAM-dependent methyltransferase
MAFKGPGDQAVAIAPRTSDVYYGQTIYWNNFDAINAYVNSTICGSPDIFWMDHCIRKYGVQDLALFLNCGNGWVERSLFERGGIRRAVGVDIAADLLAIAKSEAKILGADFEYIELDSNNERIPVRSYNCVVNHAALHHIAYLDRVLRQCCAVLPENGLLISYDYTGPHRNQYDWEAWSKVLLIWEDMPADLRGALNYPHLKTMLVMDPSEAVHSELIIQHVNRYFEVIEIRALGGAIAYPVLYENRPLYASRDDPSGKRWLERIVEADRTFTQNDVSRSLFTFFVAKPKKSVLSDTAQLAEWTHQEDTREEQARKRGGRYYPITALEIINNRVADLEWRIKNGG